MTSKIWCTVDGLQPINCRYTFDSNVSNLIPKRRATHNMENAIFQQFGLYSSPSILIHIYIVIEQIDVARQ
jgi:hypothetical protein